MILVTGTGRSGTSMWMQILEGAGIPVLGQAMPAGFDPALNAQGYYESKLLHGINQTSNPDPDSGVYLEPGLDLAVKVLADGVRVTQRAYLGRVLLSYRHWRPYAASVRRWRSYNRALPPHPSDHHPELWWFCQHYGLLHDAMTRRYALLPVGYERVLARPAQSLDRVLDWVGLPVDRPGALARVTPSLQSAESASLEPESLKLESLKPGTFESELLAMYQHLGGEGGARATLKSLESAYRGMVKVLQDA